MATLTLKGDASGQINLTVPAAAGANIITLPAVTGTALVSSVTLNFPTTLGAAGNYLATDGAGNTYWTTGGGGGAGVISITSSTGLTFTPPTGNVVMAGVLSISNGGTGATSLTGAQAVLFPTQTGHGGEFLTTDGLGGLSWAPASGGGGGIPSFSAGTTGLLPTGVNVGAITLSGTLNIANGGTGATTADNALANLLPSQAGNSGKYLTTNGTVTSWAANTDVPGGSNTNVQFNNSGAFDGDNDFTYAGSGAVTIGSNGVAGSLEIFNASNVNTVTLNSAVNTASWNFTFPVNGGTSGYVLSTDGGGNTSWIPAPIRPVWVSAPTTAIAGAEIWVDTSGSAITITLPAAPVSGDVVIINRVGVNNVIVNPNGATILGNASNFTINLNNSGCRFVYLNNTWQLPKIQLGS